MTRDAKKEEEEWLRRFHAGDEALLEQCYREHFTSLFEVVGRVGSGVDQETVVHDIFLKLMERPAIRHSFSGGSFSAWLRTLARNQAIDYARRQGREVAVAEGPIPDADVSWTDGAEARLLLERFRREVLPASLNDVFEARFLEQLSQRDAAARLGVRRTTLAYRERRVRRLLERFLLRLDET